MVRLPWFQLRKPQAAFAARGCAKMNDGIESRRFRAVIPAQGRDDQADDQPLIIW
jgi:hypothetical protein